MLARQVDGAVDERDVEAVEPAAKQAERKADRDLIGGDERRRGAPGAEPQPVDVRGAGDEVESHVTPGEVETLRGAKRSECGRDQALLDWRQMEDEQEAERQYATSPMTARLNHRRLRLIGGPGGSFGASSATSLILGPAGAIENSAVAPDLYNRRMSVCILVLIGALAALATPPQDRPLAPPPSPSALGTFDTSKWNMPFEPFQVIGPIYYVGTSDLGIFLLTTPEGHILIDGGIPETAPLIEKSVRALGFKVEDIKILLTTQAHFDHVGSLAAMKAGQRREGDGHEGRRGARRGRRPRRLPLWRQACRFRR